MSIQRKMLDKLSYNDKTDMMQLSEMLEQRLQEERNRNLRILSQHQNRNNAIPSNINQYIYQPQIRDIDVNKKFKTIFGKIGDTFDLVYYKVATYNNMSNSEIIRYIMSKDNKYIKKNGIIYYIDMSGSSYYLCRIKDDGKRCNLCSIF